MSDFDAGALVGIVLATLTWLSGLCFYLGYRKDRQAMTADLAAAVLAAIRAEDARVDLQEGGFGAYLTSSPTYHRRQLPLALDAATERMARLEVALRRCIDAAEVTARLQENQRQAGNFDWYTALEPNRHALAAAREALAGEGA